MKEGLRAAIDNRDSMTVYSKFTVTFSRNIYRPIAVTAWLAKTVWVLERSESSSN